MTISAHPDDELLAALAGADPDAVADDGLRAHVAECGRCRQLTAELTTLRSALAALPDPPVPFGFRAWTPPAVVSAEPTPSVGDRFREMLRRTLAPAMLAGASLVIVGTVGVSGLVDGVGQDMAGGAPVEEAGEMRTSDYATEQTAAPGGAGQGENAAGGAAASDGAEPQPEMLAAPTAAAAGDAAFDRDVLAQRDGDDDRSPWILVLGTGVLLLAVGVVGRLVLKPPSG